MAWIKMTIPRIRFDRFGNDEAVDWSTVRGVKFIYKAIAGATGVAKFDDLYITAGADGNTLTGAFRARYKFVFEDGTFTDESLASPVSDRVGLSAEALEIQIPQQSAIAMDTQTTAIWLYIWSASMGAYYRTISPISMNRAKKTLFEWGAFPQDGIISADDRLRILTIGRCYGRRYIPGTDPIYTVSSGTSTAPIPVVAAVVPTSTYSVAGTGFNVGAVVPFDLYSNYPGPGPMGNTIAFFDVPSITAGATVTSVSILASAQTVTTAFDGGTNVYYAVQISGVNYYKSPVYVIRTDGIISLGTDTWSVSPATGLAWTAAERNAAKFGFKLEPTVVPVDVDWAEVIGLTITDSYTIPGGTSATVVAKNVLTFRIQTSESALLQRNEKLEVGREGPPDNIIAIIGSYFTRTLCLSTDYLYISDPGRPSLYPIFQSIKVADGVNEEALWMHKAAGSVFIGTTKDIYRLSGTLVEFPNGTLDASLIGLNIGSPPIDSAVAFEGNSLVYHASDGPRTLVGESSTPLRGDLNLLLNGQTRNGIPPVDNSAGRHRLAMSEGYLYWAIPPQAVASTRHSVGEWLGTPNGTITASERRRILTVGFGAVQEGGILRYDFPSRLWARRPYSRVFRSITRDLQGRIVAGTQAGEVVTLNTGTQDNSRDIPVTILTTQQDDGRALSRKVPFDLSIRMDTGGNTATIGVYLDSASTPSLTFEASTSGQQVYKTSIASLPAFRRIQLKFEGDFSTFKLYDWNVSYRDMPQHHYHLDTGNISTANEYQWYREITFLLKSDFDVYMDVYFDDVLLSTNTVTVTAGVTTQYQIPLGRAVRGRQPRVVVRTTASASANEDGFELYWVEWKVRESGNVTQKKVVRWSAVTK